jgi:hypothetical protein
MFGRKKKELEVMWVAHGVAVKEESALNDYSGVTGKDIRRGRTQLDRVIEHLNRSVQAGEKVLVDAAPEDVRALRLEFQSGRRASLLLPIYYRFWKPALETIWRRGGEVIGLDSSIGNRKASDAGARKWGSLVGGNMFSAYHHGQIANEIEFPLKERHMARKTAREMEGPAPVRCAIIGADHSVFLPGWLKSYGIRPKRWGYSSRVSEAERMTIIMTYYDHNQRIKEKAKRAKARREAKERKAWPTLRPQKPQKRPR